ncbi:MAG: L,D-transpeptidase [Bryobacteraceae bacterium]|nr:L,D-transpeptidase [Bryobacteraceae bacterium]
MQFDTANETNPKEIVGARSRGGAVLRAQILLGRARFSPGVIDGHYGANTERAIRAYRAAQGLPDSGGVDRAMWEQLNANAPEVLIRYEITAGDAAGPFVEIPGDMMAKARLKQLGYTSAAEALGEKFHCTPDLLRRLNPDRDLGKAGETILAPNFQGLEPPPAISHVLVDESDRSVTARAEDGTVIAWYPASTGSKHDPLPIGDWKINGVSRNPVFHYNPDLFWDADASHAKAKVAPGPNNPVGLVWIDLSKDHYGIHGTPEPAAIGKAQSHGCIRLTNWDALHLAALVKPGMRAVLQQ